MCVQSRAGEPNPQPIRGELPRGLPGGDLGGRRQLQGQWLGAGRGSGAAGAGGRSFPAARVSHRESALPIGHRRAQGPALPGRYAHTCTHMCMACADTLTHTHCADQCLGDAVGPEGIYMLLKLN